MSLTRMKAALQATSPTKSLKFPIKEPSAQDGLKQDILFDERKRLYLLDPGRYVLFKGRWYLPGVTVRPVFELWNHKSLSSVEPKASVLMVKPKVCSLLSKNLLYMSASLDSLAAYQALKYFNEERTIVASVIDPPPDVAPAPIGLVAPAPADLTTKQMIKEFFRKRNEPAQVLSLEDFLTCLDLKHYLVNLRGKSLRDLKTLSEEGLTGLGIEVEHVVQMKNGINYLMDLHYKSFAFAPASNAV